MHYKIALASHVIVERSGVPAALSGLPDDILADPASHIVPCPPDFAGFGWWLVHSAAPDYAPSTQRLSDQVDETPDPATKTVIVRPLVVNLTSAELEARHVAARTARKDFLAALRWERECGGITMLNGSVIATDDRSKTLLNGKYRTAEKYPDRLHRWKGAEGEITLTSAQVIAIGDAVSDHVQDCFDRELDLIAEIDAAGSAEAVLAIDITTGWPGPEAP